MADKRISDFGTLEDAQDNDLLLVASDEETYTLKVKTLKDAVKGDADRAEAAATAASASAADAAASAGSAAALAATANQNSEGALSAAGTAASNAASAAQSASAAASSASGAGVSASNAAASAARAAQALESVMGPDTIKNISVTAEGIEITRWDDTTETIPLGSGGLSFDTGYVDAEGFLHLTLDDEDIEGFTPFFVGTGGSGGAADSTISFTNSMGSRWLSIMQNEGTYALSYSWSSLDANEESTGSGTAHWYVNGTRVVVQNNISQGSQSFEIRPYLSDGQANTVKLVLEDTLGTTKAFTWTVTVSNFQLRWNLLEIGLHQTEAVLVRLTPVGTGNKTVYIAVDGTQVYSAQVSEGRSVSYTVSAQTHGAHVIEAWMSVVVNGDTITTDHLRHAGIWTESGNTAPVIAVANNAIEISQFETKEIKYMIFNPQSETATATLAVGGTTVSTVTVNRSAQIWSYRPTATGTQTLTITSGATTATITATVDSIGYSISEVAGASMTLDPAGHSNNEQGYNTFGYTDDNSTNHPLTFSQNFDWINGGFKQDAEGVTALVIKRGTSITFDRSLFLAADNTNGEAGSTGTGKHISIIFKTENVTDYDAKIAHSFANNVGLELYAHNAKFKAGNEITCQYCEGRKVELSVNIDPAKASMKFWLAGTPAKGNTFLTGDTKTQFVQSDPDAFVIGSDACDVWLYNFKMYKFNLYDNQVLQNYIACCGNVTEMLARYRRNDIYTDGAIDISKLMVAAPNLHIITIETAAFPGDKGSAGKTTCKITHRLGSGTENDQWYSENAKYTLQGTSSMNYRQCAGNLDIDMKSSGIKVLGTTTDLNGGNGYAMTANSVPVKYFNLKANVASSENANNVCAADLFNLFNPLVSKARSVNAKCRDTVEGHPCAVFIKNTGTDPLLLGVSGARTVAPGATILYFAGDMNNSKKNTAVFGQTSEWDDAEHKQCCIEFLENTYTRCTFKSHDFANEGWKEDDNKASHFEFRYPDGAGTAAMKAKFIEMHEWVCSTDPTAATGDALSENVTYEGNTYNTDTAAYRRAKFRAEAADYFNVPNLLFYYLFTEFFLAVDNRAKNMFMSYEPDENDEWRWNVSKDYDNDTVLGIDNKGNFVWGEAYGIEDTDGYEEEVDGQTVIHPYFNAAESVLWCNVRDCFSAELAAAYNVYENAGLFNAANIISKFDTYQRIRPEALMIDDFAGKYDAPIDNASVSSWMINMEHGEKRDQRRQFLIYQEKYMSSKYVSAKAKADIIMYQAKPGASFSSAIEMTPYSDMYVGILRDNTPAGKTRLKKGQTATVQCLDGSGNPLILNSGELNIQLINGSNLKHVGGAAFLYPGQVSIINGEKLQDVLLGGENYSSPNLSTISLSAVPLVAKIDLRGQSGIHGEIDLTSCTLLEELYMSGTGNTNVYLPQSKKLVKAILGSNVQMLRARNIPNLTAANFACGGNSLTKVWIEGAPGIDTEELLSTAPNLTNGRIIGVSWELDNADLLTRLSALKGIDANGNLLDAAGSFVLTGAVHVTDITQAELTALTAAFPDLTITYDNIVGSYTVTFKNYDETTLYTESVRAGATALNPIVTGAISTPTKPSTVEKTYTFLGWDTSLENVASDLTVTAQFNEAVRRYTVRFYGDQAKTQLLQSNTVDVHSRVTYSGADLVGENGSLWMGWSVPTADVTADLDVIAVFVSPVDPDTITLKTTYDYLYSDDPNDESKFTLAEFYGILYYGRAADYFVVGDEIKIVPVTTAFSDTSIVLQVAAFDHFKISDSNNFAQTVFLMKAAMNATHTMNSSQTNNGGWASCGMRTYLNSTVYNNLPRQWKALIKSVQVMSTTGQTRDTVTTSDDKLFIPSYTEVFGGSTLPYKNEVDANAATAKFGIFPTQASRVRRKYNVAYDDTSAAAGNWWLRSPSPDSSANFCYVYTNGIINTTNSATYSYGVVFGFCL
ncbi:MAG: hypothetical protein IJS45_07510 [Clostridia bacterium]|nr:hypothetical protein [Clostridia bacterium]